MTTKRLTIYLMSAGVVSFEQALDREKDFETIELSGNSGIDGCFYYVEPVATKPAWVSFVEPLLGESLDTIRTRSASALLLLRRSSRIFAITFGYGRKLLDLSKIEYQFGLRVALNRIDPRQIRSMDTKKFEDLVMSTNVQTSKSAELTVFGVDASRDILRAVTGEPRERAFAKRLAGADSLVIVRDVKIADLPSLCDELIDAYSADDYKESFGWIDQLSLVRDKRVISELDDLLAQQLRDGNTASTHLAMPESIDWEDVDGFKIGGTGTHVYDELDIGEYLDRLGSGCAKITCDILRQRYVHVRFGRSGNFDKRWSLYNCIVSEQRSGDKLHVLIEGRWFAISATLVQEVDKYIQRIPDARLMLPAARNGESEANYNSRVAEELSDRLIVLDAHVKKPGGATSGIEFCDLLSSSGDLIHVKRKSRSSTLSHLFAQGVVSATTFANDDVFRGHVRELIRIRVAEDLQSSWVNLVPENRDGIERGSYHVTYAVIANSSREGRDWLPFFSKLNLMQHGRQLTALGFKLALARIAIE